MERVRKNFATAESILEPPHLISMQRLSYEKFLQMDRSPEEREDFGLQGILRNVFPINDFNGLCSLEFVKYKFGEPKYTIQECLQRGMSYEIPLKIVVRLITYDIDEETGVQSIRDIKEQEVFLGSLPLMTGDGVFVINGTERVIVSQLQRSPGLFYTHDNGKSHSSGKLLYSARIIPVRGSWIDLEFDIKDILHVRIDRRRKFPVTTLLKAIGYSAEELLEEFYPTSTVVREGDLFKISFDAELVRGQRLEFDIVSPQDGGDPRPKGKKVSKALCKTLDAQGIKFIPVSKESLVGEILVDTLMAEESGEVLALCNTELSETLLDSLEDQGIHQFRILHIDGVKYSSSFSKTLALDKAKNSEEALVEIYRRLRPSSPPTQEVAEAFFHNLFFNQDL